MKNNSARVWKGGGLDISLNDSGREIVGRIDFLPDVGPQVELQREIELLTLKPLAQNGNFQINVSYHLGMNPMPLASKIPISLQFEQLTNNVKLEVVRASFDLGLDSNNDSMFMGRLDYRIRNIGSEPLKAGNLQFVWFLLSGEMLDQSSREIISFGGVPLAPRQTRMDFVTCPKGFRSQRVPLKVDVYLENGNNRWPLAQGIIVR